VVVPSGAPLPRASIGLFCEHRCGVSAIGPRCTCSVALGAGGARLEPSTEHERRCLTRACSWRARPSRVEFILCAGWVQRSARASGASATMSPAADAHHVRWRANHPTVLREYRCDVFPAAPRNSAALARGRASDPSRPATPAVVESVGRVSKGPARHLTPHGAGGRCQVG